MKNLLGLLASGIASIGVLSAAEPANKPKFAGSFDTLVADSYTSAGGFTVQGGNVSQSTLTLGVQNAIRPGDYLSVCGWVNLSRDFKGGLRDKTMEGDVIIGYNSGPAFQLFKGAVSLNTDFQYWDYPNRFMGEHDMVTDFGASWTRGEKIPLTLSANWRHLFPRKDVTPGDYMHLSAATSVPLFTLGKKNKSWKVALNPEMNAVLSRKFYLPGEDWNLRPFVSLGLTAPKENLSFRVGAGYNLNLDNDPLVQVAKPRQSLFQAGINYKF